MNEANCYLRVVYIPAFNAEFMHKAMGTSTGFVPYEGSSLEDILCEQYERVVSNDNCVLFGGRSYQIPKDQKRRHYVKVSVRVHRYSNGDVCIFHGPRKLAVYDARGALLYPVRQERAQPAANRHAAPTSFYRAHSRTRASAAPCHKATIFTEAKPDSLFVFALSPGNSIC